jgi:hypothetical protein
MQYFFWSTVVLLSDLGAAEFCAPAGTAIRASETNACRFRPEASRYRSSPFVGLPRAFVGLIGFGWPPVDPPPVRRYVAARPRGFDFVPLKDRAEHCSTT